MKNACKLKCDEGTNGIQNAVAKVNWMDKLVVWCKNEHKKTTTIGISFPFFV